MRKGATKVISSLLLASLIVSIFPSIVLALDNDGDGYEDPYYYDGTYYYYLDAEGNFTQTTEPIRSMEFSPDEGIGGFVSRLYNVALGRGYDEEGFYYWCIKLYYGKMDGATVAEGFLFSTEFQNKTLSNEEYVTILYNVFFDRDPDPVGFEDWVGQLEAGQDRANILDGFINSTEWANVCVSFGILSGGNGVASEIPEPSEGTIAFVNSLYEDCLGRGADALGLEYWTSQLTSQSMSAKQVAYGFFFSLEFANRFAQMTTEEKVNTFYRVFLDREMDSVGAQTWIPLVEFGGGITDLFRGFADSQEFANKCRSFGVICGDSISLPASSIDLDFYDFYRYEASSGIEILNQVTTLNPTRTYTFQNVQTATTKTTEVTISDADWNACAAFAAQHFDPDWSPATCVAYTMYWLHYNVNYGNARGGYATSAFIHRTGQCAQYNGALMQMMSYLGYDVTLIQGRRGYVGGNQWQHYWGEIEVNGVKYLIEVGNEGQDGYWFYFLTPYAYTRKFLINGQDAATLYPM